MAPRKIEWQVALADAGVKKGVKGIDKELATMRKAFESLNKIKAFEKGQKDLKSLEKALVSAKSKASDLSKAAATSGKRLGAAYKTARSEADQLKNKLQEAEKRQAEFGVSAGKAASQASKQYRNSKEAVASLNVAYKESQQRAKVAALAARAAQQEYKNIAIAAKKGSDAQKVAALDAKKSSDAHKVAALAAKTSVAELANELTIARNASKAFGDASKVSNKKFSDGQKVANAEVKELSSSLKSAEKTASAAGKAAAKEGKRQENAYKKAAASVKTLEQAVRKQTGEVAKQSAAIKKAGGTTRNLAQTQRDLSQAFKASAVDAKKAGQASASSAKVGIKLNSQYRKEIEAQRKARRDLAASGKASAADLARADKAVAKNIQRIRKEMRGLPTETKRAEKGLAALSRQLSELAGGYLDLEIVKQGFVVSAAFGDELAAIEALTGASIEQMEQLKAKTYELSGAAGGPTAVAEAMAELSNAGVKVNDILFGTKNVRDMVTASRGLLTFGQAGSDITDILNQLGLTMRDSKMVVDQLVDGWSSASQTAPELLRGLKEVLGIYKAFYGQLGEEKVLAKAIAGLDALADLGFKGSRGGRMLKTSFIRLIKPADAAETVLSQIADDEKELLGTGQAVLDKHKELIRVYDDTGKLNDYSIIIDDIGKAALSEKESLQLFGAEAGPAMFAQVNKGGQAVRDLEKDILDSGGAAAKTSEIMQSKLGGSFRLVAAEAEKTALILLGPLDKGLTKGINSTFDFAKKNKELTTVIGVTAGTFALYAAGSLAAAGATALLGTAIGGAVLAAAGMAAISAIIIGTEFALVIAARSYMEMRDAQKEAAAAAGRAEKQEEKYQDRLKRASQATGLTIKSYKDVQKAYKSGALDYDALTDTYSKGSGVARKAAEVQVQAAKDVAGAAAGTAEAVKDSVKVQEISLKEAQKEWDSYAEKIRDIEQQIADIGTYGGGSSLQGLQKINGEWQYFVTNAEKASYAIEDFSISALGTGEVADKIFELSLAGKSDIEVWNARKKAAEQYAATAANLKATGKMFAAGGDLEAANRYFDQAAEVTKKSESAYRSLATTVKAEWTPAMEDAHKTAASGVKKYEKAADKALSDAAKHYDKARSAGQKFADKQDDLAAKLREVGRAGMLPAAAYQDMAIQAKEYEAAAKKALAAGDFDKAVELAGRAESAWDSLGNEVKDGENTVVSAQRALADQASGIQSAGQVALDALKAQEAAETKAAKAAEDKAKRATVAKEAEAKKVAALEKEKEKVIISAEQGAQAAVAGTLDANQQLVGILEAQKTAIGEVADALNKQTDWQLGDTFTDAGTAAKGLGKIVNQTVDEMTEALDAFQRSGEKSIQAIEQRLDALVAKKRVIHIEVKETTAKAEGGLVHGFSRGGSPAFRRLSNPYITRGGGVRDDVPAMLKRHEYVLRTEAVKAPELRGNGVALASAHNKKDWGRMRNILNQTLGMPQIRVAPAMRIGGTPPRQGGVDAELKGLLKGLQRVRVVDNKDGSQYDYLITPEALEIKQARDQRRANVAKVLQR